MIGFPKPTKEQRLLDRIERLKLKNKQKKEPTLPQLKKTVQRKVNAYVRERDKNEPCISCHKIKDNKEGGHYVAQGSSGFLRYHLDNIHGQCVDCNHFKSGNLLEYRISLVQKIGVERVEWLEKHRKDIKKWTREELQDVLNSLI